MCQNNQVFSWTGRGGKKLNKTMKKYLTYTEEEILKAVKKDGYALKYVKNQNLLLKQIL